MQLKVVIHKWSFIGTNLFKNVQEFKLYWDVSSYGLVNE